MEPTTERLEARLTAIPDARRRADAQRLADLLADATGEAPVVWTGGIVGAGSRHYRYDSGREGDTVAIGFAARSSALVLYVAGPLEDYADLLQALGSHTTGKGCVYLKRIDDVDESVLRAVIERSYRTVPSS